METTEDEEVGAGAVVEEEEVVEEEGEEVVEEEEEVAGIVEVEEGGGTDSTGLGSGGVVVWAAERFKAEMTWAFRREVTHSAWSLGSLATKYKDKSPVETAKMLGKGWSKLWISVVGVSRS